MPAKARRIDLYPDQFIAGIAGKMSPEQLGVYWMICLRIYSHGKAITDSAEDIAGLFKKCNPRTVRAIMNQLEVMVKLHRNGAELMANGCRTELEAAAKRIRTATENGLNGGRPVAETDQETNENSNIIKPPGFSSVNQPENPPALSLSLSLPESKTPISPKGVFSVKNLFSSWYEIYPHKVGRADAEKAFPKALSKAGSVEILIEGVRSYKRTKPPDRSWLNPGTWLRQERWLDRPAENNDQPRRLSL